MRLDLKNCSVLISLACFDLYMHILFHHHSDPKLNVVDKMETVLCEYLLGFFSVSWKAM